MLIRYMRSTRFGLALVVYDGHRATVEVPNGPRGWAFNADPDRAIAAAIARLR